MKKKMLGFLITLSVLISSSISVFAAEIDVQAPDYNTAKYQEEISELKQKVEEYKKNASKMRAGASKQLSVNIYQQVGKINCGPACVKMILDYKTGKSYAENDLASAMGTASGVGTYVYKITEKLNAELGSNSYKHVKTSDIRFADGLMYSINQDKPVVCHVMTGGLPNYGGKKDTGHYVLATGYYYSAQGNEGTSNVTYNDPNYDNDYYGTYTSSITDMVNAINARASYYIMAN